MNMLRLFCKSIVIACLMSTAVQGQLKQETNRPYLLGPGDVVEVKVFGQSDLSANAQVDSEGNLSSLPFLEPIPAKCRSERQLQKDIAVAYSRLIKDPQISVRILERNSRQPASVFGGVRQATKVPMLRKTRLNEVIGCSP